jgi:heme exporter protein CcmD
MLFEKMIEFIKMGDYAFYVWCSFAVFLIVFIGLWIMPYRQLKKQMRS